MVSREFSPATKAVAPATNPQEIITRAIHLEAPKRSSARLEGTSNMKYAMK